MMLASEPSANSLGSVTSYSLISAQLTLYHKFPTTSEVKALVDVRLLLEKLTAEHTSVGQWVNIIGYVASPLSEPLGNHSKRQRESSVVHVQALMLWSAGPLDLGRYELCLAALVDKGGSEAKRYRPNAT